MPIAPRCCAWWEPVRSTTCSWMCLRKRGFQVFEQCFQDDLMVRCTGDTIAMSPPLIVEKAQIDTLVDRLANAIRKAV